MTTATLVGFPKGVKINEASSQMGSASRITLNERFILMLRELDAQKEDTTSQRMSLQVKMAITCQEINVSVIWFFEPYL